MGKKESRGDILANILGSLCEIGFGEHNLDITAKLKMILPFSSVIITEAFLERKHKIRLSVYIAVFPYLLYFEN